MHMHVRRKPLLCQGYQAVGSYFYLIAIPPCKSFQGPTTGTWLRAPMWTTSIPCRLALKIPFQGPVAKTQPSRIQAYMCAWLLKKVRIRVYVYVYVCVCVSMRTCIWIPKWKYESIGLRPSGMPGLWRSKWIRPPPHGGTFGTPLKPGTWPPFLELTRISGCFFCVGHKCKPESLKSCLLQ